MEKKIKKDSMRFAVIVKPSENEPYLKKIFETVTFDDAAIILAETRRKYQNSSVSLYICLNGGL